MELQQKAKTDTNGLIPPYGGELKNLIIKDETFKNDLISKATYESLNVAKEMHAM